MSRLFYRAENFNQDIWSWKTSKVTNMGFMFKDAKSFNQDISNWNVNNVLCKKHFDTNTNKSWEDKNKPEFQ